jgi:GntR family transcriptional repressor for pyruvate dehydrogenase complex
MAVPPAKTEPPRPQTDGQRKPSSDMESYMLDRILSGDWPVEHRLPSEASLCGQFDVSRTAVREAIRRLQGRGLLRTINGSGTYVASSQLEHVSQALNAYSTLAQDNKSFLELLELRMAIEGDAAAKVAAVRDADALKEIDAHMERMTATNLIEEFAILDIDFHMTLLRLSGNELFHSLGGALRDRYVRFAIEAYQRISDSKSRTLKEHRDIVEAIRQGDPAAAREQARLHVWRARSRWEEEGLKGA